MEDSEALPRLQLIVVDEVGELSVDLVVVLDELDGVEAGVLLGDLALQDLGRLGDDVLHVAVEVDGLGDLLLLGRGFHGGDEVLDSLALDGGDGHDGASQVPGELLDVDLVAELLDLVHHVEGDDGGDAHVDDLEREEEVTLQVGGVHDVDYSVRGLLEKVVPGDDLLGGVRRQGVDTRKVDHFDVMAADLSGLLVDGDPRPVTDALVRTREFVEKGGLPAVRVPGQSDCDAHSILTPGKTRTLRSRRGSSGSGDLDVLRVALPEAQLVSPHGDLDGIPEGGDLAHIDLASLGDAHVHDVPLESALAVELHHRDGGSDLGVLQRLHSINSQG